jgi:hypothetical protein
MAFFANVILRNYYKSKHPAPQDGFPLAAILVSGGFFASAAGQDVSKPNRSIGILYLGIAVLVTSLIILGIGLIIA